MPKVIAPLSQRKVESLAKKPGFHCVSPNLYLKVSDAGSASWIMRDKNGKRGLGSYTNVTLAEARVAAGAEPDPADAVERRTFAVVAREYINRQRKGWKNPKHVQQWITTLDLPTLNHKLVSEITIDDVLRVLEPIWTTKNETAVRTRGRIEAVLDAATVLKYRTGDNPARWGGNLEVLLAAPSTVHTVTHMASAPWAEIPDIYRKLAAADGVAARMLRLQILTAVRPGEARLMRWEHIDGDTWVIPATMTKMKREHRVPLSNAVVELLGPRCESGVVFANVLGRSLSDMAATELLRGMKLKITAHGFRSSFREWCAEREVEFETAEKCLAHAVGDKTSRAYNRNDAFERRKPVMEEWAAFVTAPPPATDNVVKFKRRQQKN